MASLTGIFAFDRQRKMSLVSAIGRALPFSVARVHRSSPVCVCLCRLFVAGFYLEVIG